MGTLSEAPWCIYVPEAAKRYVPECAAAALKLSDEDESPLCWMTNEACDLVLDTSKILSAGACTGLNAAAQEACKLFGDKFTALCEKLTAKFETTCKKSILDIGSFAAGECKKLIAD